MTEDKRVPELRFPEFSGEWEEKELSKIGSFTKGKLISKSDLSSTGHKCILYGELYTKYGALINEVYSKTELKTKNLVKAQYQDVLIPSSGETSLDIATASSLNTHEEVYLGGDINVITPSKDYNGNFLSLSINGKNKLKLSKYAQGKTVVHLYNSDIKKLRINFPTVEEQQKIGEFFSKLDRQIELEEKKLALLEEQKKGYMQKIFSQELRFKDENGEDYPEWETVLLGQEFVKYSSIIYLKDEEKYKQITISNSGEISFRDEKYGTEIGRKRQFVVDLINNPNTLTFVRQGILNGSIGFIPNELHNHIVTENMPLLKASYRIDVKYFTNYLKSELYLKEVLANLTGNGSAQKAIHENEWLKVKISLPSIKEQIIIGNLFNTLELKINKFKNRQLLLKKSKDYFLKKLLM